MADFSIEQMQEMQKILQDTYKEKWEPISPQTGKNKLLWMIGEVGEVIDIIKKHEAEQACADEKLRKDLVEELADVLLCYGISPKERKSVYVKKFEKNMTRW